MTEQSKIYILFDSHRQPQLLKVLAKFLNPDVSNYYKLKSVVGEILKHDTKDDAVFCKLSAFSKNKQIHSTQSTSDSNISWCEKRAANRAKEVLNELKNNCENFFNFVCHNYMDIGCGDGNISKAIGSALNVDSNKIVCIDKNQWLQNSFNHQKLGVTSVVITENEKLPFEDRSFDFITALQSLHHMKDLDHKLSEISRLLKTNGYFVIREHDCDSKLTSYLIDIEHCAYEMLLKQPPNLNFTNDYYANYLSLPKWNSTLAKYKLKCISKNLKLIPGKNPTNYFYAVYQKQID